MRLIFVSAFCICGVWVTPDVTKTTVLLELVAAYDVALKETDGGTDVATLPANSLNDRHPLIWCDHSSGVRLVAGTCSTYSRTAGASSPTRCADFWRSWASFSTRLAFAGASDRRPSNSFFWLSSSGISKDHPSAVMLPPHPAHPQLHVLDLLGVGADEPEEGLPPECTHGQNPRLRAGRKVVILCGLSSFVID